MIEDKRKYNGGHSTKATSDHDKRLNPFRDAITNACTEEDVIEVLKMLHKASVHDKSTRAAKIYLEYTLGRPKEVIDLTISTERPIFNGIDLDVPTDNSSE